MKPVTALTPIQLHRKLEKLEAALSQGQKDLVANFATLSHFEAQSRALELQNIRGKIRFIEQSLGK